MLKAGVHLHWSLPKGLAKTIGIPLLKKNDLNVLKSHFSALVWEEKKHAIWHELLIRSGWIVPIDNEKATILDSTAVDHTIFEHEVNLLGSDDVESFADALVQLFKKPLGVDYPGVPDIWLVQRKRKDVIDKVWIVESHYIGLNRSVEYGNSFAVTIPFHDDRPDNKTQPFRFLGRKIEGQASWNSGQLTGERYLQEVTAVGYNPQPGTKGFAEPTFSAFYPNCMSVFGFYDSDIDAVEEGLVYEVMGLYAQPEHDYLNIFLQDFANRYAKNQEELPALGPDEQAKFNTDFLDKLDEILKREFLWQADMSALLHGQDLMPVQTVLFGKAIPKGAHIPSPSGVSIAIANTGTEALSAYLANQLESQGQGAKNKTEDLLESIQFASQLQNKVLDVGHKFQEARHDKGFTAFPGGILWSIKLETLTAQSATEKNDTASQELTLPDSMAALLNEVNCLQFAYDKALREIPYLQRQLFADWYRYMLCSYPPVDNLTEFLDVDEILAYIRADSIPSLQNKLEATKTVAIMRNQQGRFEQAKTLAEPGSVAYQLVSKLQELARNIQDFQNVKGADGKSLKEQGKCLALRTVPAPRYWRANDPVVLFAEKTTANSKSVLENNRHAMPGATEPTKCVVLDSPLSNPASISFEDGQNLFSQVSQAFTDHVETGSIDSDSHWHPFMLEWKAELQPVFPNSNQATDDRHYRSDFIQQHYQLLETDPDLSRTTDLDIFGAANLYSGNTILTPNAGVQLGRSIHDFVENFGDAQSKETHEALRAAQTTLQKTNVLSQSLSGFHEGLLLQKQTRQLDVADPLGFPEYQAFSTNEVAPLVGKFNLTAPQVLGEFNPIRSGLLRIVSLRLIDSFGQTLDFDSPNIVTSETVSLAAQPNSAHLKPRLSQPARLNFRLLSATAGEQEMNSHPDSSPVCGWLLPNNLDHSIMVYDQDGSAMGALTLNADNPWRSAPDTAITTFIDLIRNVYLRRVVRYLFNRQQESIEATGDTDDSFLHHFLNAVDNALENIHPENFAEHQDLAILMGRPIAVVRATLNLELESPPAVEQSWTQLMHELQGHGHSSDGFTQVKFPIRLGEYRQLNDGLVGYWIETAEGQLGEDYFSSEAGVNPDPYIRTYAPEKQEPLNLFQSLEDSPVMMTLLMDPTGVIHATSGVVPVKSICLPKDQYQDALKRISTTFLTAPILSTSEHLKVSLPQEPGYEWSWLEINQHRQWQEIPQTVLIDQSLFELKFPDQPELWDDLVSRKWLQPLDQDPEQALVTTAVHKAFPPQEGGDQSPFPIDIGKRLDNFFDVYGKRIEPFDRQISFDGPQVIREGWLKLGEASQDVPSSAEINSG